MMQTRRRDAAADPAAEVLIYTDGGAEPNPGAGGWAAVLVDPASGDERELSGGAEATTNNRMELTAAIEALASLEGPSRVVIVTDSTYLKNGVTKWLPGWQARGFARREGELKNADLWRRLADLVCRHRITWRWVKGHAGHRYNERADELARQAAVPYRRQSAASVPAPPADGFEVVLKIATGGRGGRWAAHVRAPGGEAELRSGTAPSPTANHLDITAAVAVLETLPADRPVQMVVASDYLRQGAAGWIAGWRSRGWRTADGNPVKNRDAWQRLAALLDRRAVTWRRPAAGDAAAIVAAESALRQRPG